MEFNKFGKIKSRREILIFGIMFVLISVLFVNFVSATATDSNPQLSLFGASSSSSSSGFNNSMCSQSQDFVVQISPLGCEPTVVRSDLLAQQDVQVYCPLSVTQLNPLINVNSIKGVSFSGNYSKYVSSVGFYPAQAALSVQGQSVNYPVLDNIGYAVINLKQQPNESSMPDYVEGNLTASLGYDATSTFGLGSTNFYLPQLTDSKWQTDYPLYSFLNGKGYLRVDNIYNGQATISIYNSNLNKISSVTLKQGESSGDLSIPGFDLCSATMKLTLNSLSNPGSLAKLEINGNIFEVAEGQRFLGNNCQVQSISDQGLAQDVNVACTTDAGTQAFDLRTSPRVVLNVNGKNQTFGLGDFLYQNNNGYVYLGYIGLSKSTSASSDELKNMMLVLVSLPDHSEAQLSKDELSSIASLVNQLTPTKVSDVGVTNAVQNVLKTPLGITNLFLRNLVQGENIKKVSYGDKPVGVFGSQIQIEDFAGPQNSNLQNSEVESYYQNATQDYQNIVNSYPTETYPSGSTPDLGEQALYNQMKLAKDLNQMNDLQSLCSDFEQRYPKATEDISFCSDAAALSSQEVSSQYVSINGQAYQISLQGVSVPTFNDYGAAITVQTPDGKTDTYSFIKDMSITLNDKTGDFVKLDALTSNTATITTKPGNAFQSSSHVLDMNTKTKIGDYNFTLTNVNLAKLAQVSITPKSSDVGSQANFSFKIGIEKRAIQLSPDKIKEQIKNTNKTIAEWEKFSNITGSAIDIGNKLCLATGAVLTAYNLILNLKGTGLARTQVMSGPGGWNEKCASLVSEGKYNTVDDCLIKNSDQIDADVNETTYFMNQQNSQIAAIQKSYTTNPTGLSNILSSGVVDTSAFMKDYSTKVQSSLDCLGGNNITNPANSGANPISIADAKSYMDYGSYDKNNYNIGQAKNVQLYADIICSNTASASLKETAQQGLYSTLADIQKNAGNYAEASKTANEFGISPSDITFVEVGTSVKKYAYTGLTVSGLGSSVAGNLEKQKIGSKLISSSEPVAFVQGSDGSKYILVLDNSAGTSQMPVLGVYGSDGSALSADALAKANKDFGSSKIYFQKVDASSYKNSYKNPEVSYYETAPYAGVPAIVPFDLANGWYAAIKQTAPTISASSVGNSVDSSGRVESFWLCNVGANGLEEFNSGVGDDMCQSIDLNTQSTYTQFSGLSSSETTTLVGHALNAIQEAERQYKSGVNRVVINGQNIAVGTPATNTPSIQCEDFMSPKSCDVLFNVCDPVVCPTSRCNFGGAYPVKDVVQTGVIGSTLLCLPNSVALGGTDYIPVCLPGIKAGVDNWISVQKSYVQCLQTNLDTGKTTGICNEIWSLYGCNLFWQNAVPFANLAASKIIASATGQGSSGGGEYMNVQNALSNAKSSVDYITNSYASNSLNAFGVQSTKDVGVGVCKNFIQTVFPSAANIANKLSTTDSPPQYMGSFSETPFTSAAVPPTSQYQVYYHIYAGQNAGAYYSVYLKNTGGSYYQDSSATHVVDSGYIAVGGAEDQTKDFTAPSGYTELCISVNGNEQCGFKEVSTNLAANYLKDLYVSNQVNQTDITSESQCRYGTINLLGFNINIQSAPSLGITRVCATNNPGNSTDPNANTQSSRWVKVGYCDNQNVGCWLDTQSVENAINSPDLQKFLSNGTTTTLQNSTLESVQNSYLSALESSGNYLTQSQFDSNASNIQNEKKNPNKVISDVNSIINKVLYNNQRGFLLLLRGDAYGLLALGKTSSEQESKQASSGNSATSTVPAIGSTNGPSDCLNYYTKSQCDAYYGSSSSSGNGGTSGVSASTILGVMLSANPDSSSYKSSIPSELNNKQCRCGSDSQCQGYANSIVNAAKSNGEDSLLLLSVMMQESECNVSAVSGNSIGLMQISSYSDCNSLGVSSSTDISGEANYDKNIQCGALILKDKYSSYSSGVTFTCVSPSKTYTQWDAALRGYNGLGCTGDNSYVENVDKIYNGIKSILQASGISVSVSTTTTTSTQSSSSDSCVSNGYSGYQNCLISQVPIQGLGTSVPYCSGLCPSLTSSEISNFDKYKNSFSTYANQYSAVSSSNSPTTQEFEAILVAIADQENWGGVNGDALMGYQTSDGQFKGSDKQVEYVADLLQKAINGQGTNLNYQSGTGVDYSQCNSNSDMVSKMKCILSVYHTGKTNTNGFLGIIGKNTEGINYADEVMEGYSLWLKYLQSQ